MESATPSHITERDRRALAALADGSLTGRPAAALEARIEHDGMLAAALARQRAAVVATRDAAGAVCAPAALRERVAAAPTRRGVLTHRGAVALAGAALAVLVAVLLISGSAPDGPSVVAAAAFGDRPAVEPAPQPAAAKLLDRRAAGLPFPDWSQKFGWRATGARADTLDGRRLTTIFYAKSGRRIAYTIVSGAALEVPEGRDRIVEGTRVRLIEAGGRTLVTWQRRGHTCVLSGTTEAKILQELAGWKGQGAVSF